MKILNFGTVDGGANDGNGDGSISGGGSELEVVELLVMVSVIVMFAVEALVPVEGIYSL